MPVSLDEKKRFLLHCIIVLHELWYIITWDQKLKEKKRLSLKT